MPLDAVIRARLPMLDGIASRAEAMADPAIQARIDAFFAPSPDYRPPGVTAENHSAPGPHGPVPVRVYNARPGADRPGFVWMHGGAFVGGDLDMPEADVVARELAERADAVVVSVDYRLCRDGVHFPVPHDDVVAAYRWTATHTAALGIDPGRLAMGGASAGAQLAAGAAQRLRDEGQTPAVSALLLAYGLFHAEDPAAPHELIERLTELPGLLGPPTDPKMRQWIAENYLGGPVTAELPPYAFAGHDALDGLPHTVVQLCEYDALLPSGLQFARQLQDAGVSTEVVMEPGCPHAHLNFGPEIPGADHTLEVFARALAG